MLCENLKVVASETKKFVFSTQDAQNRIFGLASPWVGMEPKSIWLRSCTMGSNSSIVSNPESLIWPYFTFAQFYRVTSYFKNNVWGNCTCISYVYFLALLADPPIC